MEMTHVGITRFIFTSAGGEPVLPSALPAGPSGGFRGLGFVLKRSQKKATPVSTRTQWGQGGL